MRARRLESALARWGLMAAPIVLGWPLGGCGEPLPPTQVMLEIDAEASIRRDTERLHLHVLGGEAGRPVEMFASRYDRAFEELEWPWRLALAPLDPEPPRA